MKCIKHARSGKAFHEKITEKKSRPWRKLIPLLITLIVYSALLLNAGQAYAINTPATRIIMERGAACDRIATETTFNGQSQRNGDDTQASPVAGRDIAVGPRIEGSDASHYHGTYMNIEKRADKTVVCPGDEVEYTLIVRLIGGLREGDSLRNIKITDNLRGVFTPASPSFVASSDTNGNGYLDVLAGNIPEEFVWKYTMVVDHEVTNTAVDEGDFYVFEEFIWHIVNDKPSSVTVRTDPNLCEQKFPWHIFLPAFIIPHCPRTPDFCYLVADGDNEGSNNSPLLKYTFKTNQLELLNRLGTGDVETMILSLDGKTIYAVDGGVFGIIDPSAGIGSAFMPINSNGVGSGRGALGNIAISDIDGLSFDPTDGTLYGTVRYGDGVAGLLDLLIKIDPQTGSLVRDGFGPGVEYVVINTAAIGASDVDDIAVDSEGTLYGAAGTSGHGGDHLVVIDKSDGTVEDKGALGEQGHAVQDMEGLTIHSDKLLFGTTGNQFVVYGTDNSLYSIEKETGVTKIITRLDQNFNGYIPGDFEAITCFPVCK